MTAADFRHIALSFEGAEEGSHMGAIDFRVGGPVFATLASVRDGSGNLMLTPEVQAAFVAERPDLYVPIAGGWGRMGFTLVNDRCTRRRWRVWGGSPLSTRPLPMMARAFSSTKPTVKRALCVIITSLMHSGAVSR